MSRLGLLITLVIAFLLIDLAKSSTRNKRQINKEETVCQVSSLHAGVFIPDQRFNAFIDGIMVNMVAEMKRRKVDPLYFRVYNKGAIEHVPTTLRGKRSLAKRNKRQTSSALGGGVIRGSINIKRFGNAEVQVAGNITLIRGHWLMGPLFIIVDYRGNPAITRVKSELQAVQFDTLSAVDKFGAEMKEFQLYNPLYDYMAYFGNRTLAQQHTTELVMRHLFSNASFLVNLLRDAFEVGSFDKIIPQFGTDERYYSVLQYLFSGQERDAKQQQEEIKKLLMHQPTKVD